MKNHQINQKMKEGEDLPISISENAGFNLKVFPKHKIIQIAGCGDNIFGLDNLGNLWIRVPVGDEDDNYEWVLDTPCALELEPSDNEKTQK